MGSRDRWAAGAGLPCQEEKQSVFPESVFPEDGGQVLRKGAAGADRLSHSGGTFRPALHAEHRNVQPMAEMMEATHNDNQTIKFAPPSEHALPSK